MGSTARVLVLVLVLLAASWPITIASSDVILLHEQPWELSNELGSANVSLGGVSLPTTTLQALQRAGTVGEPLYRFNELEYQWASQDTWTFSLTFTPPPALLRHAPAASVLLKFGGLDTVAAVELNGRPVGAAANAHRPHAWDVAQLLRPGANRLRVTLAPAVAYATAQLASYPYEVPHTVQLGSQGPYNFVRKAASDMGWDWGPAFPVAGIVGPVELRGRSTATLEGMAVRQQHFANGSVAVTVAAQLLPPPPAALQAAGQAEEQGELALQISSSDGQQRWQAQQTVSIPAAEGAACGGGAATCPDSAATAGAPPAPEPVERSLTVLLEQPQLWWPHDLGQQPLYSLRLAYTPSATDSSGGGAAGGGVPAAEAAAPGGSGGGGSSSQVLTRRIGVRRVQLVTDPLPGGAGETFSFRVNGQPLYARGANLIPAHVFEPAVTPAQLRRLVADARAAHMNMLRVWGGGRYAQDAFYDACDEAGVLVWQEAAFACAAYPADDASLQEAWLEARHQAARLSSHASIAIWGGNNENEASFDWFPATLANRPLYAVDFSRLFVGAVRQAVLSVDPGLPFVDTSPSNGLLSVAPYAKRWGSITDPRFGDVHFYDYVSDAFDPATYPPAKFVSEFGFMSWPSFAAYQRQTALEDWSLAAPMTQFRLRHANGLEEVMAQLNRHFLPPVALQQAQREQAQRRQAAQAAPRREGSRAEQLAALAAGEAAVAAAFRAVEADERNPVAAVHAATAAVSAAARAPAAEGSPQAQARGGEVQEAQEARRFRAFAYLTQLQQALAYQTAVHRWRRGKAEAQARTAGVLYWQLNDVWAGPLWSGINADGSWRLLHHAAVEFFRPVLVSGVRDGDMLQVHLTNDLPVGVTGTLAVDAIPFAATAPEHMVPLLRLDAAFVAAYASRLAWSGSVAADVLQAVVHLPPPPGADSGEAVDGNSSSGGSSSRPAEAADVFVRLRFCPTAVQAQPLADGATSEPPNPFGPTSSQAAAAGSQLVLSGGSSGTAPSAEDARSAGGSGDACGAPVALPPGATQAQCEAARRLLQCSEHLVFLTELKDARLAPANITSTAAAGSSDGGGSGSGRFAVTLSSDAVALYVAAEAEGHVPGSFNSSALLLLPWQPQSITFLPAEPEPEPGGGTAMAGGGGGGAAATPAAEAVLPSSQKDGSPQLTLYSLHSELAAMVEDQAAAAAPVAGAPCRAASVAAVLFACAMACCMLL